MTVIGCVGAQDLARFKDSCLSIPPPKPQLTLGNRRIHPKEPLRIFQEWVAEVIEASTLSGIINPLESRYKRNLRRWAPAGQGTHQKTHASALVGPDLWIKR